MLLGRIANREKQKHRTMKTPIQDLIEKVNQWMLNDTEVINNPLDYEEYMVIYASQMLSVKMTFIDMCESLLEKEKQEMKDAFDMGVSAWASGCTFEYYYNETYKDTEQ
jgi:hypothetical protein